MAKLIIDITKTAAWDALKKKGAKKIKYTFQGLAYGYGADIGPITISPTFSSGDKKWFISGGKKGNIHCSTRDILKNI